MLSQIIPSYSDIFRKKVSYERLLKGVSLERLATTCIALINELENKEEKYALQERIFRELAMTFTEKQKDEIKKALDNFWQDPVKPFGVLFHRFYLLEMLLRELNQPRMAEDNHEIPQEYNFFKAYMIVVTETNRREAKIAKFDLTGNDFELRKLEMLWKATVRQYEFNERPHLPFEQFKLMGFMKFARVQYPKAFKTYLESNHLKSIGQLLKSFAEVNKTAMSRDQNARLQKLAYLKPLPNVDEQHLQAQTVNLQELQKFTIRDLKKFPLYLTKTRGYMVIDPSLYLRKNYFGPFFELLYNTPLKDTLKFNSYSSQVSQALETNCFRPIISLLTAGLPGVLKVDDGTTDAPDGYFRIENLIFQLEYKASIFPEELTQKATVKEIRDFIDKKFIKSNEGKKGISQLANQIKTLYNGGYTDDPLVMPEEGEPLIRIYSIIIHHDFLFSLPGVNDYLNRKFEKDIPKHEKFEVMPLTIINLSVIMDLLLANCNITQLDRLLIEYFIFLQERTRELLEHPKIDSFLQAHMSFDEYFNQYILQHLRKPDHIRKFVLDELTRLAGISFDDFNEAL